MNHLILPRKIRYCIGTAAKYAASTCDLLRRYLDPEPGGLHPAPLRCFTASPHSQIPQSCLLLIASFTIREAEGEEQGQPPTATSPSVHWSSSEHICTENPSPFKYCFLWLAHAFFRTAEHTEMTMSGTPHLMSVPDGEDTHKLGFLFPGPRTEQR